ncbi:cc63b16b-cc70-4071-bbb1-0c1060474dd4 [Thermothielavioides terrestris]|uniref:Cc63b16b-cc70-4071-bbb1-0c1060474dd4 n=1 Tax=Thermothielavioides terrestris TaxID=2587410 RepID=A0A446BIS1_9PEZI|nr:cc63b16b-cc70-4071-bbb1-0c1060474dd4 [Thermothielavioides terrestris]
MATTPPPQNGRYYTQSDPAMEKYQAAWASLRSNSYVNNPSLSEDDRIYLHGIQGTYKVKLASRTGWVHGFQMMLIWDYDRIWGAFDLGTFKGILMVDHGPQREPPEFWDDEAELPSFDFTWRGTCTQMPDAVFNNPLITKGKITFGSRNISGHFEGMATDATCKFEGEAQFGPQRVGRSLQSFIDEWNEYEFFGEDETIRQPPAGETVDSTADAQAGTPSVKEDEDSSTESEGSEDTAEESDLFDDEQLRLYLTGVFDISSEDIKAELPDKAQHVALRMHADLEGNQVWGWFDMGICEGYLLLDVPADGLRKGRPLQFTYRGREAETGMTVRGTGELEVESTNAWRVKGFFRGMYGDAVRFSGKRKLMPSGISGRDLWWYQDGWADYGEHLNRWRR